MWLFLAVPWVCLQFVIVIFSDHTHLLFLPSMSCCRVTDSVLCLFLAVPSVGMWSVIVKFPDHTHMLFNKINTRIYRKVNTLSCIFRTH